ncbi:restriction endonuclease subunit S [Gordonia paraffinivorans]|nr:restriction endonuclease subunit S [Gordonia paraffinivorans]
MNIADQDYCIGRGVAAVRAKRGNDQTFVTYALSAVVSDLLKLQTGSTFPSIDSRVIKSGSLLVPSLREQERIGEALFDADNLIATLERLIAKKQAIKQGMMQQLLTGRTRLPGFDSAWKEATLGSVSSVTMGQSPAGSTYNSDARGLPLVQGNADIRDRITFDRIWTSAPTKTCEAGDVLLTVRAPVGYTAIASKRSCLGRGVCAISARHDNRFMFHALVYAEPAWALYEQGSTFNAVNSNEVRSFAIQWPTDSDERQAIARVLDDADKELASLQARLAKARAVKTGMMQQLLTGRTRLPMEATS